MMTFASSIAHAFDPGKINDLRESIIVTARNGDFTRALTMMSEAQMVVPADPVLLNDRIVVLSWAGQYVAAVRAFEALPVGVKMPSYVLPELARA